MSMTSYYIDFDYTLFDTAKFRDGLYKILKQNGFEKDVLKFTPEYAENGHKLLNLREFFTELAQEHDIALERFITPLEALYVHGDELVFADVRDFIAFLKARGYRVCCLTWGDLDFQREKMVVSGLAELFDEVIYTDKLKYQLKEINYEQAIFVDDSLRDLEGLLAAGAKQVIRIKRPNGKNSKKELPATLRGILEVESLAELQQIIQGVGND